MPTSAPVADRGHRLALGEDLGVRPDADLEILGPHALRDQRLLERHRRGRAGLQLGEIVADQRRDLGADRRGRSASPRACSSITRSSMRDDEGDARGLHRLQVDRGAAARASCASRRSRGVFARISASGPSGSPAACAQRAGWVGGFAEVAHGRKARATVDHALNAADRHHRGAAQVRAPDPAGQRSGSAVLRQCGGRVQREFQRDPMMPYHLAGRLRVPKSFASRIGSIDAHGCLPRLGPESADNPRRGCSVHDAVLTRPRRHV